MKITIAHLPEEENEAVTIQRFADSLLGGARVHKSDRHPPFRHVYISTRKPGKPHNFKENTCTIPPDMV